ncbi:MAG: hypothetical protein JKY37_18745 [Nannocystaceae bacterium]|nr:hypothetical protein [Nannocystaceae bacterium]
MLDKTATATDDPDQDDPDQGARSTSPDKTSDRVALPPDALTRALDRARTLSATWRGRGVSTQRHAPTDACNQSPTPWLLQVPDVGPACEVLLADQLLHDLTPTEREGLAEWIGDRQDPDSGAWLDVQGRPDLSLTALGWWARRVMGDDPNSDSMSRAVRVVHALGGAQRAHFSVRLWLAMGGQIPWSWLPAIPSELFLLPASVPFSPARFSPWARAMLIPYQVIARAPARLQLPDATALLLPRADGTPVVPRLTRPGLAGDLLQAFDRTVKLSRKLPRGPLPGAAAKRAQAWIDTHQQEHGGWFSVRPTLLSLIALRVGGAHGSDPRIRRGLDSLRNARGLVQGRSKVLLAQGTGGTDLAVTAELLRCAPSEPDINWLLRQELSQPGPWQDRADASAGGWPREPGAALHLDLSATCSVLETLAALPDSSSQLSAAWAASRRAIDVLIAMQEADGHFSRFERGESEIFMQRLPWSDADLLSFGSGEDDTHVRLTARCLSRLAATGFALDDDRVAKGVGWLQRTITDGRNVSLGARSLATLSAIAQTAGALCPPEHRLRTAVEHTLRARQREDGSFGTMADTALALLGLVKLGHTCVQAQRAARNLVEALTHPDTDADGWGALSQGFGLDPMAQDPSAGIRQAAIALSAYLDAGGNLGHPAQSNLGAN